MTEHSPAILAHADWSISAKKRWITLATHDVTTDSWHLKSPQRLDAFLGAGTPTHTLCDALHVPGRHTLIGLDLPLGVPRIIHTRTQIKTFPALLERLLDGSPPWQDFLSPCRSRDQISPYRPFYPHAPAGSRRAHLVEALAAPTWDALLRACDWAEQGGAKPCPLFWTVGANQVGKAAINAWRELLLPLARDEKLLMWPFDGTLDALLHSAPAHPIFAEVYPAEIYTWLDFTWSKEGKRSQAGRKLQADKLLNTFEDLAISVPSSLVLMIEDGFGGGVEGEDPFDSLVGVVGMLLISCARRALYEPEETITRTLEGWIFGRSPPHTSRISS